MIKAIIFDSDNTLLKFSEIAVPCIQKSAKDLKLRVPDKKEINALWGRSIEFMISNLWNKKLIKKFEKVYFKKILKFKIPEIKGSRVVLKKLRRNYFLGCLSAKPRVIMIKNFKDLKMSKFFRFMLSADDTKYHKPNPRVFDEAFKKLKKYKKDEILYIGDALIDYQASKKAKINFVAVLTGHYKKKDFLKLGLKKENILKSVKYLPKWLEKWNASFVK